MREGRRADMFDHVLIPLDGSKVSEAALPYAQRLGTGDGKKKITLVRVIERVKGYDRVVDASKGPGGEIVSQSRTPGEQEAHEYLGRVAKGLEDEGFKTEAQVLLGDPAEAIAFHAEHNPCDVIVMCSHGRSGTSKLTHGSVAEKVFKSTCVPLFMVRGPGCIPGL
jgi:nucleotide-binding universal stress UspA family protein